MQCCSPKEEHDNTEEDEEDVEGSGNSDGGF